MADDTSAARRRPAGAPRWWDRLGTVRVRTTLAAVAVVLVAATAGSIALVVAVGALLIDEVTGMAEDRADAVAAELESGAAADQVVRDGGEDHFVQVVDTAGQVLARGSEAPRAPALDVGADRQTDVSFADEQFVVVASPAEVESGDVLHVLVGQESSDVAEAQDALTTTLRPVPPALAVAVGVLTWWLVGRALAPVDAIRREVDRISADALARRVPQPHTRDEVANLATTMNAMLDRLEQAQQRQRRFVSDASHELRSPASAIRQHAEVSLAHPTSGSAEDLARVVLSEGHRLEQLTEHLLLLARSDEGVIPLRERPVDLDDLLLDEALRIRADGRLRVDVSAVSGGHVRGDAALLRRMVVNLVDNAARHARTTLALGVTETAGSDGGTEVRLFVDDDGPGIPGADRVRVLDRFVRLDESRARDDGGAGLGLSIVQAVALAHAGRVQVGDSPLGGARLEVRLPGPDAR